MGIGMTTAQKAELRKDTSLFASVGGDLPSLLESLQAQIDALPIDDTVETASVQDLAITAAKLASAVADLFAVVSWGSPGAEAGNVIEIQLQLLDAQGNALAEERVFEVHVADAAYGGDSATATIAAGGGAEGTIISGSGTAAVRVQTSEDGLLDLAVSETAAASRYLSVRPCHGSPLLDASDFATLVFA